MGQTIKYCRVSVTVFSVKGDLLGSDNKIESELFSVKGDSLGGEGIKIKIIG